MLSQTLIKYISLYLDEIDKVGIQTFLESSPYFPNLISVINTLRYAGLNSQVGKCRWEYLENLKSPFLLHIKTKIREELIIAQWNNTRNCVKVFNKHKQKWEYRSHCDLVDIWDGVVIYTENKLRTKRNIINSKLITISLLVVFVAIVSIKQKSVIILPTIIGMVCSIALFLRKFAFRDWTIEKFCKIISFADCDSVENSSYGNFYGITLSTLASTFFGAQLIVIVFSELLLNRIDIRSLLIISSIIIIPIAIYSTISQYKIKKICPICVLIVICVLAQAIMFWRMPLQPISIPVIILFIGSSICLLLILQYLLFLQKELQNLLSESIQFLKFKRRKDIISIESRETEILSSPLALGCDDAKINITTILSPDCQYCRILAQEIFLLLERGIQIRWNIIFAKIYENDDVKLWVQNYINDKKTFAKMLYDWSRNKKNSIMHNNKSLINEDEISVILNAFDKQISKLKISILPQICLNGRLLSDLYFPKDLKFVITDEFYAHKY